MAGADPFRFINDQDDATVQRLIDRLEFRNTDLTFVAYRDEYFARLPLVEASRILVIGCGSGAIPRALARRPEVAAAIVGLDHSPRMIAAARERSAAEGVADRIEYRVGDAHALDEGDTSSDLAILHTVISHVTDPPTVLREAARVLRPGGRLAVFDGDYASLTLGCSDPDLGAELDAAIIGAVVNNPRVLRDLPRFLPETGLELVEVMGRLLYEVGAGSFFANVAESFAPLVTKAGLLPAERVEWWQADQRRALADGTFFGACTYYTYLLRRSP